MDNVATFKTNRDTSTSLVVVDQMSPREALSMHTKVKEQGRGAVKSFVKNDTAYDSYPKYYYALKKKGVVPFKPRGPRVAAVTENPLELRIQQLELQLQSATLTPSRRALDVLGSGLKEIAGNSRKFLCDVIRYDRSSLTDKQEKWLSDLEAKYS